MPFLPDIELELFLEAPSARVWDAWTAPVLLEVWLCAKAEVEPRAGGRYELFWDPANPGRNSTLGCRVAAAEPGRLLAFGWKGPAEHAAVMGEATRVTVRFEAVEGGTKVKLLHAGWGWGREWEAARSWQERAWKAAFDELKGLFAGVGAR